MRVLHLTPEPPSLTGTGGAARQHHLIERLRDLGHEVTVVAPERPASKFVEGLAALRARPRLVVEGADLPVLAWQAQVFWASMRPRALAGARKADVVVVEHDHAAAWRRELPDVPSVLTLHNVGPRYYGARGFRIEMARFERHDRRTFPLYDRLVAVSQDDAGAARSLADVPVDLVPNGVATDELTPRPEREGPPTLLFTGTMSHPPNAEGIGWFVRRVLPKVPDARLLVVGRDPPERVRRLAGERVDVTGAVPDIAPYFERATVVVVPLLSGGGTRLKILEALAAGRAVVSTTIGAEGLDVVHERDILLADGVDELAAAPNRLLGDPELRRTLATEGRRLVEERYDWRAIGDRLADTLRKATERG